MDKTIAETETEKSVKIRFTLEGESIVAYNLGFGDMEEKIGEIPLWKVHEICHYEGDIALVDRIL